MSKPTYLVALNNKLTSERGILGMIRFDARARERVKAASPNGIYGRAAFFPLSIAARAAEFREITGERESIVDAYGPTEIRAVLCCNIEGNTVTVLGAYK